VFHFCDLDFDAAFVVSYPYVCKFESPEPEGSVITEIKNLTCSCF